MFIAYKVFLLAAVLFSVAAHTLRGETVKRELVGQPPGFEFAALGHFGPISKLPTHPSFAHLGLTPQQSVGFINVLLASGLLRPHVIRPTNSHPFVGSLPIQFGPGNAFGPPAIDPYFLFLLNNYAKYLPYGLGPQGMYGSTGFPKLKPLGVFKYNDKN